MKKAFPVMIELFKQASFSSVATNNITKRIPSGNDLPADVSSLIRRDYRQQNSMNAMEEGNAMYNYYSV